MSGTAEKLENFLDSLANEKDVPFFYYLLAFFFILTLKKFIEVASTHVGIQVDAFIHYYVFYFPIYLGSILILHLSTKEPIEKMTRLVTVCFVSAFLAPIIDLILTLGAGAPMDYIRPSMSISKLPLYFLTFMGTGQGTNITWGIRIEALLVFSLIFFYVYRKTKTLSKAGFWTLLTYAFGFLLASAPIICRTLGLPHTSTWFGTKRSLLLSLVLLTAIFYFYNKKYFREFVKDVRVYRMIHFQFMHILGFSAASLSLGYLADLGGINLIFRILAIFFACMFSLSTNNLADIQIDKISNKKRPTATGKIPVKDYRKISWSFLILAVIFSAVLSFKDLFLILLFMGNYFIYSCPPLRLKRVTFFSKMLISGNSMVLFFMGWSNALETIQVALPWNILALFLLGFTAVINFIDIKDYKGDKKEKIPTLPVVLGPKKSKLLIGSFFAVVFPSAHYLLPGLEGWMLPLFCLAGLTEFFLVNRTPYSEGPVFIVYLSSIAFIISYHIWSLI